MISDCFKFKKKRLPNESAMEALMTSSRDNLSVLSLSPEINKVHECKSHPKKKIFMFCLNHDLGICSDCWTSSEDDHLCKRYKRDCDLQPIENYLR